MSLTILYSQQIADNPSKALRVIEPLRRLAALGAVTPVALEELLPPGAPFDPARLPALDLVFLHLVDMNTQTAPTLEPLLSHVLSRGTALVCDTDDPYFIPADAGDFEQTIAPHLPHMRKLCALAHVLTVTTDTLKREMQAHARNVVVVPNLVDPNAWPQRVGGGARLRVGFSGGPTHMHDLTLFLPAMRLLQQRHDVDCVLYGLFDRNIAATAARARALAPALRAENPQLDAFGHLADALEGVRYEHHPSTPYAAFPETLAALNLDIGVCPLHDTRFSRCRSGVKFYQYAAAGTLCVASDLAPYRGECNLLVSGGPEAWAAALVPLLDDAELRAQHLAAQRAFVARHRSYDAGVPLYLHLFSRLAAATRGAGVPRPA